MAHSYHPGSKEAEIKSIIIQIQSQENKSYTIFQTFKGKKNGRLAEGVKKMPTIPETEFKLYSHHKTKQNKEDNYFVLIKRKRS
jgi:hypothetical protein